MSTPKIPNKYRILARVETIVAEAQHNINNPTDSLKLVDTYLEEMKKRLLKYLMENLD